MLRLGRRRRSDILEIIWTENAAGRPRLGLIVPRFQHSAVARNRLRRQLREIWRTELQQHLGSVDLVIRARPEGYRASFDRLRQELLAWLDLSGPA